MLFLINNRLLNMVLFRDVECIILIVENALFFYLGNTKKMPATM